MFSICHAKFVLIIKIIIQILPAKELAVNLHAAGNIGRSNRH